MVKKLTEQLQKSEKVVGQLYPVLVDKETKEILDGRERKIADPEWKSLEWEVEGKDEKEKQLKRLLIKHHSEWHRKEGYNRQEALAEIAEITGWRGRKPFADALGVSEEDIGRYLPQKYKDEVKVAAAQKSHSAKPILAKKSQKASQILTETLKEAKLQHHAGQITEENVANLEIAVKTLDKIVEETKIEAEIEDNPELQIEEWLNEIEWEFSLWNCLKERPEGFGDASFHGNCEPTIIAALLKNYSSLDDKLIFDPMAGSGTFFDVAKVMGYKDEQILVRDIKPLRDNISFGDALETKLPKESVDFIFAHFPYWKLVEYSKHEGDLSLLKLNEFLFKSEEIIKEMYRVLKKDGYFAIMIGNLRQSGVVDLESMFSNIGTKYFTLWDKIVKRIRTWNPETRGQRMGLAVARARQHNHTVVNHDTILVFRKD